MSNPREGQPRFNQEVHDRFKAIKYELDISKYTEFSVPFWANLARAFKLDERSPRIKIGPENVKIPIGLLLSALMRMDQKSLENIRTVNERLKDGNVIAIFKHTDHIDAMLVAEIFFPYCTETEGASTAASGRLTEKYGRGWEENIRGHMVADYPSGRKLYIDSVSRKKDRQMGIKIGDNAVYRAHKEEVLGMRNGGVLFVPLAGGTSPRRELFNSAKVKDEVLNDILKHGTNVVHIAAENPLDYMDSIELFSLDNRRMIRWPIIRGHVSEVVNLKGAKEQDVIDFVNAHLIHIYGRNVRYPAK